MATAATIKVFIILFQVITTVFSEYPIRNDGYFRQAGSGHLDAPYGFFDQFELDNEIIPPSRESLAEQYFNLFQTASQSSMNDDDNQDLANRYHQNLTEISNVCPRDSCFASYNPSHRRAVNNLANLYRGRNDIQSLIQMSKFLKRRPEIHPQVWYASMMKAQLMQMPNTLSMQRPSPIYLFPTRFFPDSIMNQTNTEQGCAILDENVGADNGVENRLWYFREDVLLNTHHWVWHLLYPLNATELIDRRGEAFYFFHHEMTARYIAERFSNDLDETIPFNFQLNSVVEEGYNSHLADGVSSTMWAVRPPMQSLSAVLNSTSFEQLYNLTLNRDRVVDSLFSGTLFRGNRMVPIHTHDQINELGELSEASTRSANPEFYGTSGYHNQGHLILATLIGNSQPGTLGVMGDETTAMRDIIFYRWHKLVDMLFQTYKELHLPPYFLYEGDHPLIFEDVELMSVKVISDGAQKYNLLKTFWNTRYINLFGGLDFNGRNVTRPRNVNICAKHLDHDEFTYKFKIVNYKKVPTPATVRIFMAPRYKPTPKGLYRYTMSEQRSLFFSLDSFITTCNQPADWAAIKDYLVQPGNNIVKRRSTDSTLTASWPKSVERLRQDIMSGRRELVNCECGFPHHLLLPKGKEEGMAFDLFVMLTDATVDRNVKPMRKRHRYGQEYNDVPQCTPSHIHCGIPGQRFPDSKPLGYPFDRRPYLVPTKEYYENKENEVQFQPVQLLEEYVGYIPNMATTQILITHENVQVMNS